MCLISRHTRLIGSYLRCLAGACHGASWRCCEFPCRSIANVAVASWRVKSSTANLGVTGYRRRRRLGARLMESGPVGRDRAGGARPATRLDGYVSGRRRRRRCQGRTGAALLMVITASPESSVRVCSFHSAMLSSVWPAQFNTVHAEAACKPVRDVKSRAGQRNYSGLFWCATTRTSVTRVGPGQRPYGSGALRISPNK
jgi:hypothetical protein